MTEITLLAKLGIQFPTVSLVQREQVRITEGEFAEFTTRANSEPRFSSAWNSQNHQSYINATRSYRVHIRERKSISVQTDLKSAGLSAGEFQSAAGTRGICALFAASSTNENYFLRETVRIPRENEKEGPSNSTSLRKREPISDVKYRCYLDT